MLEEEWSRSAWLRGYTSSRSGAHDDQIDAAAHAGSAFRTPLSPDAAAEMARASTDRAIRRATAAMEARRTEIEQSMRDEIDAIARAREDAIARSIATLDEIRSVACVHTSPPPPRLVDDPGCRRVRTSDGEGDD